MQFIIWTSCSSLTYKNITEIEKKCFISVIQRSKQEHDPEDSGGDAVIKDSTKVNSLFHCLLNISAKSQALAV